MSTTAGSTLRPVSAGLSVALHVLIVALAALVVVTATVEGSDATVVVWLTVGFLAIYVYGVLRGHSQPEPGTLGPFLWLIVLTLEWLALVCLSDEAMYIVFPMMFLYLRIVPGLWGAAVVAGSTTIAVVAFGVHRGFSLAGVIGPVLGAVVAIALGLGYRSLVEEVRQRQLLIEELTLTRHQLASAERAAGVLDERARLAREIHDTVSQSLSSIILLLHSAERSAAPGPSMQRIGQAREAASDALAETRQFINELSPPALRSATIVDALHRLGDQVQSASELTVNVIADHDADPIPTPIESALLRVAQSALANVVQHARASRVDVTLSRLDNEVILDVVDDGVGFDPDATWRLARRQDETSFGLSAMRDRAAQLGGHLVVESALDGGTKVVVSFEVVP